MGDVKVTPTEASLAAAKRVMDQSAYRIWPADAQENIAIALEHSRLQGWNEYGEAAMKVARSSAYCVLSLQDIENLTSSTPESRSHVE